MMPNIAKKVGLALLFTLFNSVTSVSYASPLNLSWTQVARMADDGSGMFDGNCNLDPACVYGMMTGSPTTQATDFSIAFPLVANEILFVTGDGDSWGMASLSDVLTLVTAASGTFSPNLQWIDAGRNGASIGSATGNLLQRAYLEDPWITLEGEHCAAVCSEMLWGENDYGTGSNSRSALKEAHGGVNVYVRQQASVVPAPASLALFGLGLFALGLSRKALSAQQPAALTLYSDPLL